MSAIRITKNDIPRITREYRATAATEVKNAALALEAQEKQFIVTNDSIDTGFMLNSVQAEQVSELTWSVGNGAEYSIYVNYGTYKQAPAPFVEPAVDIVNPQFVENLRKALGQIS